MASIKISGLTEQTTASDTDLLPVASSAGMAKRMTLANFVTWLTSKLNSKFAPAGYGLGGVGASCSDPNTALASGLYGLSGGSCVNIPTGAGHPYGPMVVENRAGVNIEQKATFRRISIERNSEDGGATWSEWEWVNPPMALNTEYRTTERWLGHPVYTKLVDCGMLPNCTTKVVAWTDNASVNKAIRFTSSNGNGGVLPMRLNSSSKVNIYISVYNNVIDIETEFDASSQHCYTQVWYTKTTG